MSARTHITGASGSGVTTLGAALARRLECPQLDVDDFYWAPTDPLFAEKRPVAERLALLEEPLQGGKWVLSGSLVGWGDPLIALFDIVVFLQVPTEVRMARLKAREKARYGDAIEPGGRMHETSQAFLSWASQYNEPHFASRSLAVHERWLDRLTVPVLRLDGTMATNDLVEDVLACLREL